MIPPTDSKDRGILVLLAGALLFFAQDYEFRQIEVRNIALSLEMVFFGLASFSLLFLAARATLPGWADRYMLIICTLAFSLYILTLSLAQTYALDAAAFNHCAAQQLLQGRNPYTAFDPEGCFAQLGLPETWQTRWVTGEIESNYAYPAGSFLFLAPFFALGLSDARIPYWLALLAMALLFHASARPGLKNLVLLGLIGNVVFARFSIAGIPDPPWALFVAITWLWLHRSRTSAASLGIACSVKQLAWFFVPFYLIAAWRERGLSDASRRIPWVVAGFLIPNLPFIIMNPSVWLESVLAVAIHPLAPGGAGLIALPLAGLFPLGSQLFYTALEGTLLALAMIWYFFAYRRYKPLGVVLGTLVGWFGWRSLLSHFYLNGFLMLGLIAAERPQEAGRDTVD